MDAKGRTARGASRPDPRIGENLAGRYAVDRLIATGGMGRVYVATQSPLDRKVAVKILHADFRESDTRFAKRFFLEAAICARLSHPNIVTVHDYGETDGGDLFMVMELLDGAPLTRRMRKDGPFSPVAALDVAIQVARALREAHGAGVIHRDLKPGNIVLVPSKDDDGDIVKVLDFGIVKIFAPEDGSKGVLGSKEAHVADETLTRAGTLLGSPRCMSPEQIRGDALDPRTDIYSLGVILYQLVTGKAPFTGATSVDVIYKHLNEAPVPPSSVGSGANCPAPLEIVILRCLSKDREERYESMAALLEALKDARRLITGQSVSTDSFAIRAANNGLPAVPPAGASNTSGDDSQGDAPQSEAAFADGALVDDPTRGTTLPGTRQGHRPRVLAFATALTVCALAIALGLTFRTGERAGPAEAPPARPADAPTPEPEYARVTFSSSPGGATVFEGDVRLGVTPLIRDLKVTTDAPRSFVFRRDGHQPTTVVARIVGAVQKLEVQLLPAADDEPKEAAKPEPKRRERPKRRPKRPTTPKAEPSGQPPSAYRDNPY